ncbi:adenylate/guanylate cyclase domain-containing protein [Sneathiella glossodoripedis]|uniref:adenylate/guanylate cyclase domain-containing protein n=1 Tax=Sneathiella glossodoripedis TaxID=418853 RepID=UPI000A86AD01|nr:adenylate/guanylate cyclase domain-containing protein [Sneathiella glossodoripedis]
MTVILKGIRHSNAMISFLKSAYLLGEPIEGHPPERVQLAIQRQQDQSEVLIASVQLLLVLVFAVLYFLSPKTFSQDTMFAPVPYALFAYFSFSVCRLIWAINWRLPGWVLSISVIADMSLLLFLIWSFHIQYQQPPSFYLKAPTLLYVFIFIALRALRFELRYVLLAGFTAAIGWLILMSYAIYESGGMNVITDDYVLYTMSHKILIGAEFDKVISILIVTAILALVIARARRLLINSVSQATAARDLSRFFSPEIADQITHSENWIKPGTGQIRSAAILHCDLQGFTKLSMEKPANEVIELLAEYQARMVPIIQSHGGAIDKFLGDGILATFGAVENSDSFAADCMQALDEMMLEAGNWEKERISEGLSPQYIRFTAASGQILFGAVGDESRLEYTVIGEPVNLAAKLDKHAKDEKAQTVVTLECFETALAQGYKPAQQNEIRAARHVGGVTGLVDLVVVGDPA